ncbi:unnamed protein product [Notodromas monacha]|uniref:Uncharacterized protein n=1 Tax=Notodromas monacha TaxID=399045 RepID=A0A7R9BJQ8_9CRUS|nr:unnamed protein product [Notodromas monacha]CAG0915381.1 unnamed protein product [Notodromas monacha]
MFNCLVTKLAAVQTKPLMAKKPEPLGLGKLRKPGSPLKPGPAVFKTSALLSSIKPVRSKAIPSSPAGFTTKQLKTSVPVLSKVPVSRVLLGKRPAAGTVKRLLKPSGKKTAAPEHNNGDESSEVNAPQAASKTSSGKLTSAAEEPLPAAAESSLAGCKSAEKIAHLQPEPVVSRETPNETLALVPPASQTNDGAAGDSCTNASSGRAADEMRTQAEPPGGDINNNADPRQPDPGREPDPFDAVGPQCQLDPSVRLAHVAEDRVLKDVEIQTECAACCRAVVPERQSSFLQESLVQYVDQIIQADFNALGQDSLDTSISQSVRHSSIRDNHQEDSSSSPRRAADAPVIQEESMNANLNVSNTASSHDGATAVSSQDIHNPDEPSADSEDYAGASHDHMAFAAPGGRPQGSGESDEGIEELGPSSTSISTLLKLFIKCPAQIQGNSSNQNNTSESCPCSNRDQRKDVSAFDQLVGNLPDVSPDQIPMTLISSNSPNTIPFYMLLTELKTKLASICLQRDIERSFYEEKIEEMQQEHAQILCNVEEQNAGHLEQALIQLLNARRNKRRLKCDIAKKLRNLAKEVRSAAKTVSSEEATKEAKLSVIRQVLRIIKMDRNPEENFEEEEILKQFYIDQTACGISEIVHRPDLMNALAETIRQDAVDAATLRNVCEELDEQFDASTNSFETPPGGTINGEPTQVPARHVDALANAQTDGGKLREVLRRRTEERAALNREIQSLRDSKKAALAKIDKLIAEKMDLEACLSRERTANCRDISQPVRFDDKDMIDDAGAGDSAWP